MKLFSGSSNKPLAESIAQELEIGLSPIELHVFPDGERRIKLNDNVVEQDCVVIQPTNTPVDQNYMELFFLLDACKRSGAKSVTAVVPYLGYQRQDHVFREGEAVSLEVVIRMMEAAGATKIVSVDLHSIKIPELFHIPIIHLSALPLFAEEIKKIARYSVILGSEATPESDSGPSNLAGRQARMTKDVDFSDFCLVSPDMGGIRRIKQISEMLDGMPYVATVKDRDLATGKIQTIAIEGDKKNIKKRALIVDDMASSGKTLIEAAKLLHSMGVEESIAFVTHAIFSEDAPQVLQNSILQKVYVTDTVLVPEEKRFEKLEIISLASEIAKTIKA